MILQLDDESNLERFGPYKVFYTLVEYLIRLAVKVSPVYRRPKRYL